LFDNFLLGYLGQETSLVALRIQFFTDIQQSFSPSPSFGRGRVALLERLS